MMEKRKVLIIDDEEDLVQALLLRLRASADLAVNAAYDGDAGLRLAADWSPDVVFVDVAMPGLNGLEVCRRLRADRRRPQPRLIVMTAGQRAGLEDEVMGAGADGLLIKPFDETALAAMARA